MYVLICYDVPVGRTERYRKVLARYLVHEQNSVFAGDLPESKLLKLRSELGSIAIPEDHIIEITASNRHNVSVSLLQKAEGNGAFVKVNHDHHKRESAII
jgi:CRISPR-associated protein Cas2